MSIAIDFAKEDIQRGKLITPGWFRVHIDSADSALSKDGGSTNYNLTGTITRNADTPADETYNGFPTPRWSFNSKAKGFMIGFFAALDISVDEGKRYDLEAQVGKDIEVFIENGLYNGQMQNQINHKYRKVSA